MAETRVAGAGPPAPPLHTRRPRSIGTALSLLLGCITALGAACAPSADVRVLPSRWHGTDLLREYPTRREEPIDLLQQPLGADGRRVAVNGTELFVRRMGSGDPVMVVHGGPMLDHGYLLPHLAPLASDHEMIFYDQRLNGRSAGSVDPERVRLATFVDDIEALRVTLGLDRIHLMGHSFGGLLAMSYAIRYGDKLRSLILLDSMAASSELWQREQLALDAMLSAEDRAQAAEMRASAGVAAREPAALEAMLRLSFSWQFHDRALVERLELYVPDDYAHRSAQFGAIMRDLVEFDLHAQLAEIDVPALLVYGSDEPGGPLGGAAIHARLPASRFIEISAAGHFPFVEQPEALLAAVRDFLRDRELGSPDR